MADEKLPVNALTINVTVQAGQEDAPVLNSYQ